MSWLETLKKTGAGLLETGGELVGDFASAKIKQELERSSNKKTSVAGPDDVVQTGAADAAGLAARSGVVLDKDLAIVIASGAAAVAAVVWLVTR